MTRVEQEQLVGSYLRGEMSAAEEQEFFIQVALDSDLRQTLKAFRVVETAIQKHRQAIPPNHAESYQRLLVMLGSSATEPAALIGTTTATGLLRQGLGAIGARFFNWTTALVATGALSLGALVLGPAMNGEKEQPGRTETTAVESALPQTDRTDAQENLQPDTRIPFRAAQEEGGKPTAGTGREVTQNLSSRAEAAQKTPSTIDPEAIINQARRKKGEESGNITAANVESNGADAPATSAEQTSATRSGSGVTFNIVGNPIKPEKDTIDISVKFNPKDIRKK